MVYRDVEAVFEVAQDVGEVSDSIQPGSGEAEPVEWGRPCACLSHPRSARRKHQRFGRVVVLEGDVGGAIRCSGVENTVA